MGPNVKREGNNPVKSHKLDLHRNLLAVTWAMHPGDMPRRDPFVCSPAAPRVPCAWGAGVRCLLQSAGQGSHQPDGTHVNGGEEVGQVGLFYHTIPAFQIRVGKLKLNRYPPAHIQVAHLFTGQHLKHHNILVGYISVVCYIPAAYEHRCARA